MEGRGEERRGADRLRREEGFLDRTINPPEFHHFVLSHSADERRKEEEEEEEEERRRVGHVIPWETHRPQQTSTQAEPTGLSRV